jgi:hypothetical protein
MEKNYIFNLLFVDNFTFPRGILINFNLSVFNNLLASCSNILDALWLSNVLVNEGITLSAN